MTALPRSKEPDSTLAFLREGYRFVPNRCRALHSDAFKARMMLSQVVFAHGAEAAEMFYSPGRFTRKKAMPFTTLKLLQDYGSVQTLDGGAHTHRKQMFLNVMSDESVERLVEQAASEWQAAAAGWPRGEPVQLLSEAQRVLARAVLSWAGLSPRDQDADKRAEEYAAMVRGAGDVGVSAWVRGEVLRTRSERWARSVVDAVRAGRLSPGGEKAAAMIANHRDADGRLLPMKVAAVELLNVFRPVVAVAHFIVHAALALHQHEHWRGRLAGGDEYELECFVQEVRRLAPFFPVIGGRVKEPFEWRNSKFAEGTWMVLDIYGTNRDERTWDEPEAFRPERFAAWDGSPWNFIPQGGGPYLTGHRCPGERATIALMKQAVRFMARQDYAVPEQDLSIDLARIPALPASGFVLKTPPLRAT